MIIKAVPREKLGGNYFFFNVFGNHCFNLGITKQKYQKFPNESVYSFTFMVKILVHVF